jgi:peptidoglycan/xylan/chitin deacetylase (PgdA/CDA1 family)
MSISKVLNRKGVSVFLGIVLIVGTQLAALSQTVKAAGPNLILNPTLTSSSGNPPVPLNWQHNSYGNASGANFIYPATTTPAISVGLAAQVTITNYGTSTTTGGDAKWYFDQVSVVPGQSYEYQDNYLSNVTSVLTAEFLDASSTASFGGFFTIPASAPSTWATASGIFTPPPGTKTMTIFHLIAGNGSLATGNASLTAVPPPTPFNHGFVTLTFDDGWLSQHQNALPILQAAGLHGTFYIISNAQPADGYMDKTQILDLQNAGNEIGAHTMDHCDLVMLNNDPNTATQGGGNGPPAGACAFPTTTPTTSLAEITGSHSALLALSPTTTVNTFAYPYGSYNPAVENQLSSNGFIGARSVDVGYNGLTDNPLTLKNQIVDQALTQSPTGLAQVKLWIDYAMANHIWLILTIHQVEPLANIIANKDIDATTPEFLQSIVDYIKTVNAPILTVSQGVALIAGVTPPPPAIQITPTALANATTTVPYLQNLTASTTASGPFTWSIASGTLPSGLHLNTAATGTSSSIFGTPTTSGVSAFVVAVTNGTSSTTASYQLNVIAAPPVIGSETPSVPTSDSITVTWTTDHPATSRIIYDTVSHSTLSASSTPPNYGYASSTLEDTTLVTSHSVVISGLTAGTTYYMRAVSHGSPETVGSEISLATVAAAAAPTGGGGGGGSVSYVGGGGPTVVLSSSSSTPQVLGAQTATMAHPDGTLVLDGQTVYLIKNGQRFGFRNPAEFMSYGYNFSQVVPANNADMSLSFANGNILKAMEGTLVLDAVDNRTVYMIGANFSKRGFASAKVFKALGYSFANLPKINLSDYPAGIPVTLAQAPHPEGSLVLNGQTVWWVGGNSRQGFESEAVFNTYGFNFGRTVKANAADMALAESSLVKFRDGTLVSDNGSYNIISDGQALPFASTTVMSMFGYNPANAISSNLNNYQKGKVIE